MGSPITFNSSLFPLMAPTIKFSPIYGDNFDRTVSEKEKQSASSEKASILPWRIPVNHVLSDKAKNIVHSIVTAAGFTIVKTPIRGYECSLHDGAVWDVMPISESQSHSINLSKMCPGVKINQMPGLYNLRRKDLLWTNYKKMRNKLGSEQFNFLPKTYFLPENKKRLERVMRKGKEQQLWIVKPANQSEGKGIKVINRIADLPKKAPEKLGVHFKEKKGVTLVQKYLSKPYLINGHKFDLRIYVLLTGVDPLKIYLFKDGLVRFATEPYSTDPSQLANACAHITNYAINKHSDKFIHTQDHNGQEGHKWSLHALWKYLEEKGNNVEDVWKGIKDIVVKSILSAHSDMLKETREKTNTRYNCYKLLGYDIFLSSSLRPSLIEVNTNPSLFTDPLDLAVNVPLISEMLNIVGFHLPSAQGSKRSSFTADLDKKVDTFTERLYSRVPCDDDIEKQELFESDENDGDDILSNLSPGDLLVLMQSEQELSQTDQFERLFPTPRMNEFIPMFDDVPYFDKLLAAFERQYNSNREEGHKFVQNKCHKLFS